MTTRRGFITGLISFVAAPAIVRAGSLMPIRGIVMSSWPYSQDEMDAIHRQIAAAFMDLQIHRQTLVSHWNETAAFYLP
jgi:hypothetical protein